MARLSDLSNSRSPWTEEDFARLRELLSAGQAIPEVAKAMGRSQEAVRNKAWQRGLLQRRPLKNRPA